MNRFRVTPLGQTQRGEVPAAYWHPQTSLYRSAVTSESRFCNSGCAGNVSTQATFVYDNATTTANRTTESHYNNEPGVPATVTTTRAYNVRGDVTDTYDGQGIRTHYDYACRSPSLLVVIRYSALGFELLRHKFPSARTETARLFTRSSG